MSITSQSRIHTPKIPSQDSLQAMRRSRDDLDAEPKINIVTRVDSIQPILLQGNFQKSIRSSIMSQEHIDLACPQPMLASQEVLMESIKKQEELMRQDAEQRKLELQKMKIQGSRHLKVEEGHPQSVEPPQRVNSGMPEGPQHSQHQQQTSPIKKPLQIPKEKTVPKRQKRSQNPQSCHCSTM